MRKLAVVMAIVALQVAAVAGPAGAVKPVRGCPSPFVLTAREDLRAALPNVDPDVFKEVFDAVDKNDDDNVCVKPQPTFTNLVDNTSNHP